MPPKFQDILEEKNQQYYPNIATILCVLLLIPVTSASVERSNLSLKILTLRSIIGEEKLNVQDGAIDK